LDHIPLRTTWSCYDVPLGTYAVYSVPYTHRPGTRKEFWRRCQLRRVWLPANWLYSSPPIAVVATPARSSRYNIERAPVTQLGRRLYTSDTGVGSTSFTLRSLGRRGTVAWACAAAGASCLYCPRRVRASLRCITDLAGAEHTMAASRPTIIQGALSAIA
jgi:hypothetical protein